MSLSKVTPASFQPGSKHVGASDVYCTVQYSTVV